MKRALLAAAISFVQLCFSQTTAILNSSYTGLIEEGKASGSLGGFASASEQSKIGFVSISTFLFNHAQLKQLQLEPMISASLCNTSTGEIFFSGVELPKNSSIHWAGPENFESTELSITDLKPGLYTLEIKLFDAVKRLAYDVPEAGIAQNLMISRVSSEPNSIYNRIWLSQANIVNAQSYLIYRLNEATNLFEYIGEIDPSELSFLDTTVDNRLSSYTYAVQLKDQCDRLSELSAARKSLFLETSVDSNYQVQLYWDRYEHNEVATYTLYRSVNESAFEEIARLDNEVNTFKDLSSNTALNSYSYHVSASIMDTQAPNQTLQVKSNDQVIVAENKKDDDQDGISNLYDQCPNSALGDLVDAAGCQVFTLAANAFTVSAEDATCPGSENGSIRIIATNNNYSYHYTLNGQEPTPITNNQESISNLPPGTYTICITVDTVVNYERCYTLEINAPQPLVVKTQINFEKRRLDLKLSGSKLYQVSFNGKNSTTSSQDLSLNLNAGLNRLKINGELACQETYIEEIFVSEEVKVYPNPTTGALQLFVAGEDSKVMLNIASLSGSLIKSVLVTVSPNRIINTRIDDLQPSVYLVSIKGTTVDRTLKVIKK